ncbi:hypothetical protein OG339_08285 [Streptosporangium sp. NBC_01495]|uniref:hypothetical protein n=1 Tax=Streptosporangium sp. NBC_01495 TaxID=2903899 RepID=UPI002E33313C|nr:hypothetical protein [Streptosporangium sp. NBC_01495]
MGAESSLSHQESLSHREEPGRAGADRAGSDRGPEQGADRTSGQVSGRVSGWASERFGDRADAVRRQLAASLLEAMGNAQDAQSSGHSDKRYTYGFTMMARRYEALAEGLRDEPGFQLVRPHGSPHHLVVLRGNLLLPFRYAEDDRTPISEARVGDGRVSSLVRELFDRFGPATSYRQEELDLALGEEAAQEELDLSAGADGPATVRPALTGLPGDTRLVPVAYAGNAQAGLLRLHWGEAELIDEFGRIRWLHHEPIPLPAASPGAVRDPWAAEPGAASRFDDGLVPALALSTRSPAERKNGKIFPVSSEAPEETMVTGDNEQP